MERKWTNGHADTADMTGRARKDHADSNEWMHGQTGEDADMPDGGASYQQAYGNGTGSMHDGEGREGCFHWRHP